MPCAEGTHYNERKCTCTDQEPSYPTFKEPLVQEPPAGKIIDNHLFSVSHKQWNTSIHSFRTYLFVSILMGIKNFKIVDISFRKVVDQK